VATKSLDGDPQPARGTLTIHALQQPATVARAPLQRRGFWWQRYGDEPPVDPHNPDSWPTAQLIWEEAVEVGANGTTQKSTRLPVGIYRATLSTTDRFGREVTARKTIQVVDPTAQRHPVKMPNVFTAPS